MIGQIIGCIYLSFVIGLMVIDYFRYELKYMWVCVLGIQQKSQYILMCISKSESTVSPILLKNSNYFSHQKLRKNRKEEN